MCIRGRHLYLDNVRADVRFWTDENKRSIIKLNCFLKKKTEHALNVLIHAFANEA